jgi:hypothetical protein
VPDMSGFETSMDGECPSSREPVRVTFSGTPGVRQSRGSSKRPSKCVKERQAVQMSFRLVHHRSDQLLE